MHGVRERKMASRWGGGPWAAKSFPWNVLEARDQDGLTTLELLVNGASKTQQISAVIRDLEGSESIAGIGQFPFHRNPFACELCIQ